MIHETLETDILILGGGGAGLLAAIHARDRAPSLDITIVVKAILGKGGCTRLVQGGYNAVLDPSDSIDQHFVDTITAGHFLNDQELAWLLVKRAPEVIHELESKHGCYFDRHPDGRIHQKAFAGQSFDRTVHKGDLTGIEIMNRLVEQTLRREPRILEDHRVLDLVVEDGEVCGALLLDMRTGKPVAVSARATLLATGGGPNMYRIHAAAADKSCDGLAIAYRAGAELMDMEMVQFHPTGLLAAESRMTGTVLEEGLRGAGGYLFNGRGERYMARYDPERLERSTRDIVARSSYMEIQAGRGSPHGGVFIDVSHLGANFVETHFKGMVKRCRDMGFDLARKPVEVSPTAHFMMGGVRIDTDTRTSLPGLFAAGEDAGGVHGANRLGGNGVAESTVFGCIAGERLPDLLMPLRRCGDATLRELLAEATRPLEIGRTPESVFRIKEEMRQRMWDNAGLVRDPQKLEAVLAHVESAEAQLERTGVSAFRAMNLEWMDHLNVRNMLQVSRLIVQSALARKDSRGSHFRIDCPEPSPECLSNVMIDRRQGTTLRPVKFTRLRPRE